MATKVDAVNDVPAGPAPAVDDSLQVMFPDRTQTIAGRTITMREYTFQEGLDHAVEMRPLVEDLLLVFRTTSPAPPVFAQVEVVLEEHPALVRRLIALAADVDEAWVAGLDDMEGDLLLWLWWTVAAPFFYRRVLKSAAREKRLQSAGTASSPPSSTPATGEPPATSPAA